MDYRGIEDRYSVGVYQKRDLVIVRGDAWQYIMTEKGFDIFPITVGLLAWGDRRLAQDGKPPLALQHRSCGKPLRLELTCGHCRRPTTPDALRPAATLAIVR